MVDQRDCFETKGLENVCCGGISMAKVIKHQTIYITKFCQFCSIAYEPMSKYVATSFQGCLTFFTYIL